MKTLSSSTALVMIDVQQGFDEPAWGRRNNPGAEANIVRLIEGWRQSGRPLFHVCHDSCEPGSPLAPGQGGNAFKPEAAPRGDEPVIPKGVNSAFIGTDLEGRLRDGGHDTVVFVGLTTNHCVSTSVRMAGNLGFESYVVDDATATFDRAGHDGRIFTAEELHASALASLHGEFATVVSTDEVLAALS